MFYPLSKALAGIADPAHWAVLLLIGSLVLRRHVRAAAGMAAAAAIVAGTFSSPVIAHALQRRLEAAAPNTFHPGRHYDAAVVLGGDEARVEGGAGVVRAGSGRHLLYTGAMSPRAARELEQELVAAGIPEQEIVLATRARNTWENAVEATEVMAERGWRSVVLVTSASHVPRALACFRRMGVEPDVLPVDYTPPRRHGRWWLPSRAALDQSRAVLHEVIGLVVYRVVGYGA